ncbi:HAD-IA family hydrolase [Dermatophilaceae bacterium Soc4.6]
MTNDLSALTGRDFAAVLFDMDGTLIDSTPAVGRCWARLAQEEGIDPARFEGRHGIPARTTVEALLPPDRWDAATARLTQLEIDDTDGVVLLPGAAEALAALAPQGRSAIATSCTRDLARARLRASGLVAPAVVVTVDDVERGKPHPDPFVEAARRLGADPADCLVVEDAPGGLRAGRAAGCATLAVVTTSTAQELSVDDLADAVVGDLSAVRFAVVDGRVRVSPA